MKRLRLIVGLFALPVFLNILSVQSFAQNLNVDFDFSTFRYDSAETFMELYYNFGVAHMKLAKVDSVYSDSLLFHVSMSKVRKDSDVIDTRWKVPVAIRDTAGGGLNRSFVGQMGIIIPPGQYMMHIRVNDCNDTSIVDSMVSKVSVPQYTFHKLQTSDVELCSQITEAATGSHGIFYKNTYNVIPNPKAVYGAGLPIIYYYVEVYNIPDSAGDSLFTVEYQVRDSYGQVKKSRVVTRKKFGNTSVEVGTVNGSNLKTGAYTFIFTVIDTAAKEYATTSRRFFVYNPGLGAPESPPTNYAGSSMISTVFATMTMNEIDREFKEARYIATPEEIREFKQLHSLPAKRQFLYDFWQKRNPDPVSRTNSFRVKYLQRVAYANDHFQTGNTPGWQTDRGRVYILYGKPDQIDRHPNEANSRPYQIWYYNSIQGGVTFDFVDKTGFGDYTLVNSTARNEIHNDNWQQSLNSGGY